MMHSDSCNIEVMKLKINWVQLFVASLTAIGTRMSYGITHCYLPPGWGDIPVSAFTPAKLVLDLATSEGCKAELT